MLFSDRSNFWIIQERRILRFSPGPISGTQRTISGINAEYGGVMAKSITLKTGQLMPLLGLGTWKSKPGEVAAAVKTALELGYRNIDCAYVYGNEKEIGAALKEVFDSGKVKREEVFITSKLWNTFHNKELVRKNIESSLSNLGLKYLDLYLIHWPHAFKPGTENFPKKEDGSIDYSDVHFLETWPAMEELVKEGLTKAIGLSNFNSKQIEQVLNIAKVQPSVLQVECHPYLNQKKLVDFAASKGIVVTAYSPLGSADRPWAKPEDPSLLDDPKIAPIAKKHNKSNAQVILRWLVQRGIVAIPKSVNPERLKANIDIFDFELDESEMDVIYTFNKPWRACPLDRDREHPLYPFKEEF
eukprot:TRINITY_DN1602_c0_g1_i2.p1 TRINITY_DN1602_c0_g1~~TRINITY_DN1602_c0_g1_i2.p1  ORF type:complete len:357 (-),score=66.14 TRINITY_DN1602_c0_g1_i2:91-1161(-)